MLVGQTAWIIFNALQKKPADDICKKELTLALRHQIVLMDDLQWSLKLGQQVNVLGRYFSLKRGMKQRFIVSLRVSRMGRLSHLKGNSQQCRRSDRIHSQRPTARKTIGTERIPNGSERCLFPYRQIGKHQSGSGSGKSMCRSETRTDCV